MHVLVASGMLVEGERSMSKSSVRGLYFKTYLVFDLSPYACCESLPIYHLAIASVHSPSMKPGLLYTIL